MRSYTHIIAGKKGALGTITFNRPSVHNALNIEMIREFKDAFGELNADDEIMVIMIQSNGRNFSAGADLEWMKAGLDQDEAELHAESTELALLFHDLYNSTKTILTTVRGRAIGGANGIIATSDIVIASETAAFSFSEVRIGLVPATISPFVVRKVGASVAGEWMLSGRMFNAIEAYRRGYIHHMVPDEQLSEQAETIANNLMQNAPAAMKGTKELLAFLDLEKDPQEILKHTSGLIARFRVSEEGQEGIRAFFEKRQPQWRNEKS